eukprot:1159741-Pelagomonas_calceolata.AAC.7
MRGVLHDEEWFKVCLLYSGPAPSAAVPQGCTSELHASTSKALHWLLHVRAACHCSIQHEQSTSPAAAHQGCTSELHASTQIGCSNLSADMRKGELWQETMLIS